MASVDQPFEDIDLNGFGDDQADGESPAGLPPLTPLSEIVATYPSLRRPVIEGLLRVGETANVVAAPKIRKSWLVGSLALSLVADRDWLGMLLSIASTSSIPDSVA